MKKLQREKSFNDKYQEISFVFRGKHCQQINALAFLPFIP